MAAKYILIQIGISKAIYKVPHEAVRPALRVMGLPEAMVSWRSHHRSDDQHRIGVELLRGIKQGDLLSPFLFNAILDPVLRTLDTMGGFSAFNACMINNLGSRLYRRYLAAGLNIDLKSYIKGGA